MWGKEKTPELDTQTAYLLITIAGQWGYMQCIQKLWQESVENNTSEYKNIFTSMDLKSALKKYQALIILSQQHATNCQYLQYKLAVVKDFLEQEHHLPYKIAVVNDYLQQEDPKKNAKDFLKAAAKNTKYSKDIQKMITTWDAEDFTTAEFLTKKNVHYP